MLHFALKCLELCDSFEYEDHAVGWGNAGHERASKTGMAIDACVEVVSLGALVCAVKWQGVHRVARRR